MKTKLIIEVDGTSVLISEEGAESVSFKIRDDSWETMNDDIGEAVKDYLNGISSQDESEE